jgi:hypothetical protein
MIRQIVWLNCRRLTARRSSLGVAPGLPRGQDENEIHPVPDSSCGDASCVPVQYRGLCLPSRAADGSGVWPSYRSDRRGCAGYGGPRVQRTAL